MPNIAQAYQWAIDICNAPNVGYSQAYRNQQTVNGITYYDCSSFINYALLAGGWATPQFAPDNNAFTTFNMGAELLRLGAESIPVTDEWQAGDILVRNNSYGQHTEMVYSGRRTMGAHTNRYPLAEQVSISNYESNPATWDECYRFGKVELKWITGNRYLTETEMQNNAFVQFSDLTAKGWGLNAIAGLLGNEETESTINPGVWQNLSAGSTSLGYGLVQWTPSSNITSWLTQNGYALDDGFAQDIAIDIPIPAGQWIATSEYPISFLEFKKGEHSPEDCASIWLKNFERAGVEVEQERRQQARKWYEYLKTATPITPGGSKPIPEWYITRVQQYAFFTMQKKRRKRKNDSTGHYYFI